MSQRSDIIWLHKELAEAQLYLLECALGNMSTENAVLRLKTLKKKIDTFVDEYEGT